MATKIKGITIQIGGDTSGLTDALKSVNKEIKTTQYQLKDVEKMLKLDPSNTELLAQKQKLLAKSIEEANDKLKILTDTEKRMKDSGVDENSDQFLALRREILQTEGEISKLNDGLEETGEKSEDVEKTKKSFGEMATIVAGVTTAIAGVVKGISSIVSAYGEYEQLAGGVDTLFGEDSAKAVENANKAFQTAGMSASEYLETVTSFSASLIQSLEGDTAKAVEVADKAIIDMSDNANKMGTDISSIQNAYQGFAKQNYTMLDNLKLGYGGTKEEMQRLLADANEYNRQQGIMTDYQIENYADIVEAIHVVQEEMGIAGATQLESATTIEGSINSLKSAYENLVVGLSGNTEDIGLLMQNVMDSFWTVVNNIKPVVDNILASFPNVLSQLIDMVVASLPDMLAGATDLFMQIVIGLANSVPDIIASIPKIVSAIWDTLKKIDWIQLGKDIIQGIIDGMIEMVKSLIETLSNLGTQIKNALGLSGNMNSYIDPVTGAKVDVGSIDTSSTTGATTTPTVNTNTSVQVEFTGDLAQLGKVLQPVVKYETTRLGGNFAV